MLSLPQTPWFWMPVGIALTLYCIVQAVRDLRARRYGIAALGFLAALVVLNIPIKGNEVTVTLPSPSE